MSSRFWIYRRLLGYLRPYWPFVAVAYAAMAAATLINLFIPQIIKTAIDRGLQAGQARTLYIAGLLILGIAVVRSVVSFSQRYYGEWLTHRVAYDLRNHFYLSVQHLPFAFHDRAQTGDLMSRATSDVTETERFAGIGLLDLVATILLLVGVSVAMFLENALLAGLVMIPLAVLVATTIYFGNTIRPLFKRIQEQMGVLSSVMQESMTGIGVVKAFAREDYELKKFDIENDEWFTRRYKSIRLWGELLAALYVNPDGGGRDPALVWRVAGDCGQDDGRVALRHDLVCADAQRARLAPGLLGQHGGYRQRQR